MAFKPPLLKLSHKVGIVQGFRGAIVTQNRSQFWALSEEEIEKLKRLPLDERKSAFLNLPPTHVNPTRRRINVGANKQPQEDISSETYITADKAVLQQVIDGSHPKINDRALEDELKPIIER